MSRADGTRADGCRTGILCHIVSMSRPRWTLARSATVLQGEPVSDELSPDQRLILRGRRVMSWSVALFVLMVAALIARAIVADSPEVHTLVTACVVLLGLNVIAETAWAGWLLLGGSATEPARVRQNEAIRVLFTVIAVLVARAAHPGRWLLAPECRRWIDLPVVACDRALGVVGGVARPYAAVRRYPALPQDLPWHARRPTVPTRAGWYHDPHGSAPLRWWDGARWTDHIYDPAESAR